MNPDEELAANQLRLLFPGNLVEFPERSGPLIVDDREVDKGTPLLGEKGGEYRLVIDQSVARLQIWSRSTETWVTAETENVTEVTTDVAGPIFTG